MPRRAVRPQRTRSDSVVSAVRRSPTTARCGAALTADVKFCIDCGCPRNVSLPEEVADTTPMRPDGAGELRLVSVLFCDLVGHTARSEQVDADVVRELLVGYFDVPARLVGRHGGTLDKFIGDAVLAVWGVPVALENDAERAVRAGLELVDAVEAYGDRLSIDGLQARVGVVTGRAAAMDQLAEGIVVGDRVNTVARIQSIADPGTVLVDSTTRDATSAAIAYSDGGAHSLKGKAEPVQVWRAERAIAGVRGIHRPDGLEAELVGRDGELRLLKELFHTTIDRRTARLVSSSDPAGVGKSRLAWEFDKYVDGLAMDTLWHSGRCLSYGDGVAYWSLAQMVRQRLGIAEADSGEMFEGDLDDGLERWVATAADRQLIEPRLASCSEFPRPASAETTCSAVGGCSSSDLRTCHRWSC